MKPELTRLQKGRVTSLGRQRAEERGGRSMAWNPTDRPNFKDTFGDSASIRLLKR